MGKRKFILSYVNEEHVTEHYDHQFDDMNQLEAFVTRHHPDCTSYQIIVTMAAE